MNEPTDDIDDEDEYDEEDSEVDTDTKIKDWGRVADYLDMVAEMAKDGPQRLRKASSLPAPKQKMKELIKRAFIHKWQTGTSFYGGAFEMEKAFSALSRFVPAEMLEKPDWAQIAKDHARLLAEWNEFVSGIAKYRIYFEYWGSSDWSR